MAVSHVDYEKWRASGNIQQKLFGSRRTPQPPRSIVTQPGSFKGVVTWNAPQDNRGIVGYIVYVDNETSPYQRTGTDSRRVEVPITSGTARFVAISSVNQLGVESPKIPTKVTSTTDTYNGGSTGTSPGAPPNWNNEPSGGKNRITGGYSPL